jgi:hypothetical protein
MFRPGLLTDAIAFTVATGRCDIPTNTRFPDGLLSDLY